jgi:hypothetical protein
MIDQFYSQYFIWVLQPKAKESKKNKNSQGNRKKMFLFEMDFYLYKFSAKFIVFYCEYERISQ